MQPRRRPSKDKGIIMASKIMANKKQKKGVAHPVAVKPGSSKKPLGTTKATPIDSSKATPLSAPTTLSCVSWILPRWYSFTPAEFRQHLGKKYSKISLSGGYFPVYPWGYPSTPGGTTPFQCILSRHHVRLEPLQAQGMLRAAHGVSWWHDISRSVTLSSPGTRASPTLKN